MARIFAYMKRVPHSRFTSIGAKFQYLRAHLDGRVAYEYREKSETTSALQLVQVTVSQGNGELKAVTEHRLHPLQNAK